MCLIAKIYDGYHSLMASDHRMIYADFEFLISLRAKGFYFRSYQPNTIWQAVFPLANQTTIFSRMVYVKVQVLRLVDYRL